jgi:hypothetical protein
VIAPDGSGVVTYWNQHAEEGRYGPGWVPGGVKPK